MYLFVRNVTNRICNGSNLEHTSLIRVITPSLNKIIVVVAVCSSFSVRQFLNFETTLVRLWMSVSYKAFNFKTKILLFLILHTLCTSYCPAIVEMTTFAKTKRPHLTLL